MANEKKLVDDFGRVHDYLRISLTEKCNLRCSYCMPFDLPVGYFKNNVRFTPQELNEIIRVFTSLGLKKIRLTGGEPLVRKEARNIIQSLSEFHVELAITSNGILINDFFFTLSSSGIKSVNLSLDTLKPDKFFAITKRDVFKKVLFNIHLLLINNFKVKINVVVIKGFNDNEILDFVEWTRDLPLQIRFIEFMPFKGNLWGLNKVFSHKEILDLIGEKYSFTKLDDGKNSTSKNYKVNRFAGSFGVISTMSEPFCNDCNRMRLTADGKLKNCLFSREETDILNPLREGKDIRQLIIQSVKSKKEKQGGQLNPEISTESARQIQNRCMVAIGG